MLHERDSLLKDFAPFFYYDSSLTAFEISGFERYLADLNKSFTWKNESLASAEFNTINKSLIEVLKKVYNEGIIQLTDVYDNIIQGSGKITIVKGSIGEEKEFNNVFVQKDAYQFTQSEKSVIENTLSSAGKDKMAAFVNTVSFYDFFKTKSYLR